LPATFAPIFLHQKIQSQAVTSKTLVKGTLVGTGKKYGLVVGELNSQLEGHGFEYHTI